MNRIYNDITTINNCEGAAFLTFGPLERMEWLIHGFSTRKGGVSEGKLESLNLGFERGDRHENVVRNFELLADAAGFDCRAVSMPNQWHTNNVRVAGKNTRVSDFYYDRNGEAIDGQVTNDPGTVLITYGADCTPIFLADPVHKAIGLCHSGWKGTLNSISEDTIKLMTSRFDSRPEDIVSVIGPSISMDSYQVGEDVASGFIKKHNICVTGNSSIVKKDCVPGKFRLDLWEANRENLLKAGLKKENIYISGVCTFKEKELMYSHRRDGNERGVMAAFMCIS